MEQIDTTLDNVFPLFSVSEALKLRLKHKFSYQMIADKYGITKQAVHQRLRRFMDILDRPDDSSSFNEVRKNILDAAELKLLEKILDPATLKDASLNNAAYTYQVVFNANRLEHDKSTSNVNFSSFIQGITDKNKAPETVTTIDNVNK